ncbi:MAG: hypothetical protein H7Z16_11520 [Pyrinomonadaceae bacterium]|nr:hypothetical protein [Pyrinomonadaceae bacterium]
MKLIGILFLVATMGVVVCAQRPRAIETTPTDASKATPARAPQSMKAKYEGGIFGYNKAMEGTLLFDDTNKRLLFRNKQQKDLFFVPYNAVVAAFGDTQKRRPGAASVAQHVPIFGAGLLGLIKTKVRYLTLQFNDPDTHVSGTTSFRLASKDLVDSVVYALANKAGLTPRGEIYVRKKDTAEVMKTTP